jgi:Ca2+-binding EF-hand superfamily protein
MLMVRRETLGDFQHLLTDEGRRAEAAHRLKGIEQLEAAFDAKGMDVARNVWWRLDKNKDGYVSYQEFPHPDWTRANRNGDENLDWAEELADRVFRSLARQGKYQAKYGASPKKEWASWHAWGVERPDFEQLFPYIDWDRDGKITAVEYKAFEDQVKTYTDPSFPKTNENGQTGMDIFLGRMPGQSRNQSRKTSWDSQEDWNRDKPTVQWIFPFIDKNDDGRIDSEEYQAIQEYKKQHTDWQDRARKELGIEPLQGN